jgi:hypothetical protein
MMRGWLIEVDGTLYQAESQDFLVKFNIGFGVPRERGRVVEPQQGRPGKHLV